MKRLRDLEISFANMLTDLHDLFTEWKCDLSKAKFFLNNLLGTEEFNQCTSFDELLWRLCQDRNVDTFNTYFLQALVALFKKDRLTVRVKEYEAEKEQFLRNTTVLEFQQAVVNSIESVRLDEVKHLTIRVLKLSAGKNELKDIEELAIIGLSERQRAFIRVHARVS